MERGPGAGSGTFFFHAGAESWYNINSSSFVSHWDALDPVSQSASAQRPGINTRMGNRNFPFFSFFLFFEFFRIKSKQDDIFFFSWGSEIAPPGDPSKDEFPPPPQKKTGKWAGNRAMRTILVVWAGGFSRLACNSISG